MIKNYIYNVTTNTGGVTSMLKGTMKEYKNGEEVHLWMGCLRVVFKFCLCFFSLPLCTSSVFSSIIMNMYIYIYVTLQIIPSKVNDIKHFTILYYRK